MGSNTLEVKLFKMKIICKVKHTHMLTACVCIYYEGTIGSIIIQYIYIYISV